MIDAGALSPAEAAWVDAYHAQVLAEVGPRLEAEGAAAEAAWLRAACAPL
jgi:Xaa-Pro aminopeptidase